MLPLGLGVGFFGSLAGIGGGLFAVPVLYILYRLPLAACVGTSLAVVAVTTSVSTVTEFLLGVPTLHWRMIAAVAAGSLVGAQLGFSVASKLAPRPMRQLFIVLLFLAGLRVLFDALDLGGPRIGLAEPHFSPWEYGLAMTIGLVGGVISPLLGSSGGLLVTPGLFMFLPTLGFTGARATSLAAGFVAASRSLYLLARAKRVEWHYGFGLAPGALIGAVLGTRAVHLAGMAGFAQIVLCCVLFFTAWRFFRELRYLPSSRAAAAALVSTASDAAADQGGPIATDIQPSTPVQEQR
jgi:uncharacterized protein